MVREVVLELRAELNGSSADTYAPLQRLDAVQRRLERLELALKRLSTDFGWRFRMSELLRRCGITEP